MRRKLFLIASVVSLLLFVASFAVRLDVRDHAHMLWCGTRTVFVIGVGSDGNALIAFTSIPAEWTPDHTPLSKLLSKRIPFFWRTGGAMPIDGDVIMDVLFDLWKRQEVYKRTTVFNFPFWTAQLACAALPAAWIGVRLRRWRQGKDTGLCAECGYDLRATPEPGGALLGQCPECGRATDQPAVA